jgi:hypothetical protein
MVAIGLSGTAQSPEAPPLLACALYPAIDKNPTPIKAFMRATPLTEEGEALLALPGEEVFAAVEQAMAQYVLHNAP